MTGNFELSKIFLLNNESKFIEDGNKVNLNKFNIRV